MGKFKMLFDYTREEIFAQEELFARIDYENIHFGDEIDLATRLEYIKTLVVEIERHSRDYCSDDLLCWIAQIEDSNSKLKLQAAAITVLVEKMRQLSAKAREAGYVNLADVQDALSVLMQHAGAELYIEQDLW